IKKDHFMKELNFCYLNDEGRKLFVKKFEEQLEQTVFHRGLKRKIKYKNLITLELYKIMKHIIEDKKYSPLKVWW
ncbi:MAG: subtype I-B CRISPR-associated endonuclease Cas1, partial [bacterium]|nr:subtype I-B CRISPR-associated endonuclease Cas1 [bacterium]